MKSIIYYFTGTGNSLAAAKKIGAALGDCELVSIASLKENPKIRPDVERVGIIFPLYFSGLPAMVSGFAERLNLSSVSYCFAIVTLGGKAGSAALKQLDGILTTNTGRGLDAAFSVPMPSNYILLYAPPQGSRLEEILSSADRQLSAIIPILQNCQKKEIHRSLLSGLLHLLVYPWFTSHVHSDDRKFTVDDRCTSCGTCAAICPAGNIDLVQGKPVWKHHCELCCGCIHMCLTGAIQGGPKTASRPRYRNPSVSIEELKQQSGRNIRE